MSPYGLFAALKGTASASPRHRIRDTQPPRRIPRYAAPCRIRDTQPRGASRDTASDFRRRRGTACSGEKDRAHTRVRALSGGDGGIRTLDLCVANASLSQLSYAPVQADIHKCKYDFIRVVLTCQGLSKKSLVPFLGRPRRGKPCKKGASLPPPISAVRLRSRRTLPAPPSRRTLPLPHPLPCKSQLKKLPAPSRRTAPDISPAPRFSPSSPLFSAPPAAAAFSRAAQRSPVCTAAARSPASPSRRTPPVPSGLSLIPGLPPSIPRRTAPCRRCGTTAFFRSFSVLPVSRLSFWPCLPWPFLPSVCPGFCAPLTRAFLFGALRPFLPDLFPCLSLHLLALSPCVRLFLKKPIVF